MSIAETVKTGFERNGIWDQLISECELLARDDIDQDWENESTQYNFVDGSCIVICGPFVNAYNSQN